MDNRLICMQLLLPSWDSKNDKSILLMTEPNGVMYCLPTFLLEVLPFWLSAPIFLRLEILYDFLKQLIMCTHVLENEKFHIEFCTGCFWKPMLTSVILEKEFSYQNLVVVYTCDFENTADYSLNCQHEHQLIKTEVDAKFYRL